MSTFFKDIKERTKDGDSIFIFPEGTRNKSDSAISDFKEGSQIIAIKNRLHILPVYIRSRAENTLLSAIKNSKVERFIEIEFGDIIDYKDRELSLQEAYSRAFNIAQ
jgi:1-acyl-sn-glycerol-3-phosphate acyltransferase